MSTTGYIARPGGGTRLATLLVRDGSDKVGTYAVPVNTLATSRSRSRAQR